MVNYFKYFSLFFASFLFANNSFAQEELVYSGWDESLPFNWKSVDREELDGAMVEFLRDFFKEQNIKIKTRIAPWKRVLHELKHGRVDVVGALYMVEERKKFAVYSIPYSAEGAVVIALKAKPVFFNKREDLIGKRGGAVRGLSFGKNFDTFLKEKLKIERVSTLDLNLKKLNAGRIDYILNLTFPSQVALMRSGGDKFMILPKQLSENKVYLAFSKKSPYKKYFPAINEKIQQMLSDGSLQKLIDKYLQKAASE